MGENMQTADHSGHRQRLRKKYLDNGLDGFEMHECLELLLFYGIPRKDTNLTAHKLLDKFGSLSAILDAPVDALTDSGLSENAAVLLKLIPDFARLYVNDKHNNDDIIFDFDNVGEYMKKKFLGRENETVVLLLLDNKGKEIFCGAIEKGSLTETSVPMKKIIDYSMRYNAFSAIIAHNHPSGIAIPSRSDITATNKLYDALALVGVNLIDHIIVADNDYVSLAESEICDCFYTE